MAGVLIGWELGAGRGHLVSMRLMAEALVARGHKVTLAAQRLDGGVAMPKDVAMVQAPLWPGLLSSVGAGQGRIATIADVLARIGLGRQGVLGGMIAGWDGLIAATGADLVIADYAPALLAAAHGRVPSISTGPGFQVSPSDADPLPRLGGGEPGHDEGALLDTIDAERRAAGREPLPRLAALFATDAPLIASFPQLDPYGRDDGNARFIAPGLDGVPQPGAGQGNEVFVYANSALQANLAFWRALAATRLPVRAHIPGEASQLRQSVAKLGIRVEPRPLPIDQVVARTRLNLNHGAHGIICTMLLAGVPQIMLPLDLEKRLHSEGVARLGLGVLPEGDLLPQLTDVVRAAYDDPALAQRARDAAPAFAARMAVPYGVAISEAVEALT
jgi:rhamnosyltransferase subunit B